MRKSRVHSSLAGAIMVLTMVLVTSGCSDKKDAEPTPTQSPFSPIEQAGKISDSQQDEALERFDELREKSQSLASYQFDGTIEYGGTKQAMGFGVDYAEQAFEGTVEYASTDATLDLEMIRASKLTWLKAPDAFWFSQGFDEPSVKRARGKYVVFDKKTGDDLAAQYDPIYPVKSLAEISDQNLKVIGSVDLNGDDAYRYEIKYGQELSYLDIPASIDLFRYVRSTKDINLEYLLTEFNKSVSVDVPPSSEVMQPEE